MSLLASPAPARATPPGLLPLPPDPLPPTSGALPPGPLTAPSRSLPPGPPPARQLAAGAALSLAGSVAGAALGLLLTVVLARGLGEAGAGVTLQVVGLLMIAGVGAKLGLDSAALWQVPRLVEDEPRALRALVGLLLGGSLAGGLVAGALLWAWAGRSSSATGAAGPTAAAVAAGLAWAVPLLALVLVALAVVRALGGLTSYVLVGNLLLPGLRPALVVLALVAGGGAAAASRAWALALVPTALALLLVLRTQVRRAQGGGHGIPLGARRARAVVGFALPRTVSTVLEQVLVWAPVLLLGVLADDAAAGRYGSAVRFVAVGLVVDAALRVVVAPRISALLHRGEVAGVQDLYRTTARWLVLLGTPGFVLLAVHAPTVLGWLGPGFVEATAALRVLCLGTAAVFLAGTVHTVLLMGGHPGRATANKTVALATLILGLIVLVPAWGVVGAAWAWVAAIALDATLALAQVRRLVGVHPDLRGMALPLAVGVLTPTVPALAVVALWGHGTSSVVVSGLLALLALVGAGLALRGPLQIPVGRLR